MREGIGPGAIAGTDSLSSRSCTAAAPFLTSTEGTPLVGPHQTDQQTSPQSSVGLPPLPFPSQPLPENS